MPKALIPLNTQKESIIQMLQANFTQDQITKFLNEHGVPCGKRTVERYIKTWRDAGDIPEGRLHSRVPFSASLLEQAEYLFSADESVIATLITACHILAHHNVLDGFGHITVRSPTDPSFFYISSKPAALITSPKDYTVFNVMTGVPLDPSVYVSPYSEHYIHAGFYAAYPEVGSVVHSHARETLPFGIQSGMSGQRMRAVIHTAGFLGNEVPVWDIADVYPVLKAEGRLSGSHPHSLLVNTLSLGQSLASAAVVPNGIADANDESDRIEKHSKVVLQRGHGFTATGTKIEEAVFNSIYTVENAIVLRTALDQAGGVAENIKVLSEEEVQACTIMDFASLQKVWPLWVTEVERNQFYRQE